jgi:hypothetical protein
MEIPPPDPLPGSAYHKADAAIQNVLDQLGLAA